MVSFAGLISTGQQHKSFNLVVSYQVVEITLKPVSKTELPIGLSKTLLMFDAFYDVKEKEILSKDRRREIAHPRQMVMYLMREELKYSYPLIGSRLGGRDHEHQSGQRLPGHSLLATGQSHRAVHSRRRRDHRLRVYHRRPGALRRAFRSGAPRS